MEYVGCIEKKKQKEQRTSNFVHNFIYAKYYTTSYISSCHLNDSSKMKLRRVSSCKACKTINSPEKRNNLQPFEDRITSKSSSSASYKNVRCSISCRRKLRDGMRSLIVTLFFVTTVCLTGGHGKSHGQFCRYWCRTPDNRYYCCPSGKTESWIEYAWHNFFYPLLWHNVDESPSFHEPWSEIYIEKEKEIEKHCPPLRTHCPRKYDLYLPPTFCHTDEDCSEWEKCCYDVCLEHKTCKPVEF